MMSWDPNWDCLWQSPMFLTTALFGSTNRG